MARNEHFMAALKLRVPSFMCLSHKAILLIFQIIKQIEDFQIVKFLPWSCFQNLVWLTQSLDEKKYNKVICTAGDDVFSFTFLNMIIKTTSITYNVVVFLKLFYVLHLYNCSMSPGQISLRGQ